MQAYVLTTPINGRKNYVANQMSARADNKQIVNYTINPNAAKDFGSLATAERFISKIVNPHERIFSAEVVEVDELQLQPMTELADDSIK